MVSLAGRNGKPGQSRGRRTRQAAWLVLVVTRHTRERDGCIQRDWRKEAVRDTDITRLCESDSMRERERQCGDMNEGSVVKAVRKEVWMLGFDESVPLYSVLLCH